MLIESATGVFNWLMQPISGPESLVNPHLLAPALAWHGRLMVLSWGILLPLGVLIARFFKVMPGQNWPLVLDNPLWWRLHLHGQSWAVVVALAGIAVVWGHAAQTTALAQAHGLLGWSLMALALFQLAAGWLRGSKGGPTDTQMRGDHYDMTRWRRVFERLHKSIGYAALLLAMVVLAMGLAVADAPRWMALALGFWWMVLIASFVRLQAQGRCIDTYQAIWGNSQVHPGNAINPIGLGVRRY